MQAWFSEVIWYWIFAAALLYTLGKGPKITGQILAFGLSVVIFIVVILLYAGVQPRING